MWPQKFYRYENQNNDGDYLIIRNKRRAYKNMATANGVYNTASITHNTYYTKQLKQNFKTASFPHCYIYTNAESSKYLIHAI